MPSAYLRTLPVILVDPAPDLEAALHLQLGEAGAALLQRTVRLHLALERIWYCNNTTATTTTLCRTMGMERQEMAVPGSWEKARFIMRSCAAAPLRVNPVLLFVVGL